jgi:hypothetical protein
MALGQIDMASGLASATCHGFDHFGHGAWHLATEVPWASDRVVIASLFVSHMTHGTSFEVWKKKKEIGEREGGRDGRRVQATRKMPCAVGLGRSS